MFSYFSHSKACQQRGMTLIEVLIASVILFIAIGTIAGIHRVLNHYQRLNLADYALVINQSSFFDYLSYSLDQNITAGEYNLGQYKLIWQATLNNKGAAVSSYNIDLNDPYQTLGELILYDVTYFLDKYPDKRFEVTKLVIHE